VSSLRSSRGFGRAAPVVALVLALGCGGAESPETLRLWAMGREGEAASTLVAEFERRHPGVRVEVQRIPWSAAHEKLLTAFVGQALPDVMQVGNTWLPELALLEAIAPLDERLDASSVLARDDWFPGILDTNVIEGRTWGIPWYVDTRLLFYRSDLLAAAGYPDPPRTWTAWREAMRAVRRQGGPDRFGILLPPADWQPLVILAFARGARLLRDGNCRGDFRAPAFREALAFYVALFQEGLAPLGGAAVAANLYQDFARGDLAFVLTGPWNLGEFARRLPAALASHWSTAPMPAADPAAGDGEPDGPGPSLAGGASLVLVRGSPRADLAWQLIEFLGEPAQQLRLHELTGDLPARKQAWELAQLQAAPRVRAFWEQLQFVRPTPKIPEWERIAGKVGQWAEVAVRGQRPLDAALAALDAEVDAILEKRRWLRGGCAERPS